MLFNFFHSLTLIISHLCLPPWRFKSHSPCWASGWVLVSGSILNSQGDERPDQHTHILRQSRLCNWTATTETIVVLFLLPPPLPSPLRCSLQSELLALVWPLQPASSAQASTAALHLSDWAPLWRVERERERASEWERENNGEQKGREEREEQFPHCGSGERERYGWRGLWQCWMFPLWSILHSQHIFFSHQKENLVTSVWKT